MPVAYILAPFLMASQLVLHQTHSCFKTKPISTFAFLYVTLLLQHAAFSTSVHIIRQLHQPTNLSNPRAPHFTRLILSPVAPRLHNTHPTFFHTVSSALSNYDRLFSFFFLGNRSMSAISDLHKTFVYGISFNASQYTAIPQY